MIPENTLRTHWGAKRRRLVEALSAAEAVGEDVSDLVLRQHVLEAWRADLDRVDARLRELPMGNA